MPQLDFSCWFTQYFWFTLTFLVLFFKVVSDYLPKVYAGRDTTCNLDDQIYINATGTGTITWVSGDNIACKDCPNTQIIPKYTGCYIAESVNEFGCKVKDEVCINITTDHGIYIPSAFTPNGDGLNDIFLVLMPSCVVYPLSLASTIPRRVL